MKEALENGHEQSYPAGQTIYEEGSKADGVYLILEGEVDLLRQKDGEFHELATLISGNLVGEAGVFAYEKHSTSLRARTKVRVLFIEAETFRKSFSDPLVKHVVTSMAKRLRDRYVPERELIQQTDVQNAFKKKKSTKHSGEPIVEGVTPLVIDKLVSPVRVTEFPFVIGNTRAHGEMAKLAGQSLMMPLPSAPDLEPQHFELVKHGKDIWIRDLGSKNGTVVNGETVSKYGKKSEVKLETGENIVGTGGMNSRVTFLITLNPA